MIIVPLSYLLSLCSHEVKAPGLIQRHVHDLSDQGSVSLEVDHRVVGKTAGNIARLMGIHFLHKHLLDRSLIPLHHLGGNVLLGGIMLPLLARLAGPGRALLLTVLGGGLGNLLTVALRREFVLSQGFSTAVFAAIGALAGYMVLHHESKRYLPLAAGVGILAMWGMGEGNVDYLAHICGLVAGMALGFWEALRTRRRWPGLPQWLSALLALLLPVLAWIQVFQQG